MLVCRGVPGTKAAYEDLISTRGCCNLVCCRPGVGRPQRCPAKAYVLCVVTVLSLEKLIRKIQTQSYFWVWSWERGGCIELGLVVS